jgi:endo-1,3(4)-beta-glucanase
MMWWVSFIALVLLTVEGKILNTVPISTDPSVLPKTKCPAAPSSIFQGTNPPYPTNTWWGDATVLPSTGTWAGPFPYVAAAVNAGAQFGLPNKRHFDGVSIHNPVTVEFLVGAKEFPDNINNHKVVAWDELTSNFQWFSGAATMNAYFVPGSAYMTFQFNQATVNIQTQNNIDILTFNSQKVTTTPTMFSGSKFTLTNSLGMTYLVYALSPISFSVTSTLISTSGAWSGILRFAALNTTDPAAQAALDASSSVYATSADISYEITGNTANLNFMWNVVSGDPTKLLQLAFIHHRTVLQNPNYVTSLSFLTIKGYQNGILGNKWTLQYTLPTISFFAPRALDKSCTQIINEILDSDSNFQPPFPNDFYYWGGTTATFARLALIAEELGRWDLIPKIVAKLQQAYAPWFNGTAGNPASYETLWGGVCATKHDEFYQEYYNDHHFHYGYHLFIAGVIGKYDPAWLQTNIKYLQGLARDIGNPSTADPYYPVTRHRDWFQGHSWASGVAGGAGPRDEESSTEGINGYYGLYLFARSANDCQLQNFARLLMATEIQAVHTYWHMYTDTAPMESAYPEPAIRVNTTIGNVMDFQAGSFTVWSGSTPKIYVAGIEILPYTAATEYVIDSKWATGVAQWVAGDLANPALGDDWKSLIYLANAVNNPTSAWQQVQDVSGWGSGNTNTNGFWWIASRPGSSGSTCANTPSNGPSINSGLIQSVSNGMYLTVGAGSDAFITGTLQSGAILTFSPIAGGTTIQSNATKQYASIDNTGTNPMIINRATPSGWETFVFIKVNGNFVIKALSNGKYLGVGTNNEVFNNINTPVNQVPQNGLWKLVCPNAAPTCPGPVVPVYPYNPSTNTTNYPYLSANCGMEDRRVRFN